MTKMTPILESILITADIHAKRLNFAMVKLEPFHPFTSYFFIEINEDKVMLLDFFCPPLFYVTRPHRNKAI